MEREIGFDGGRERVALTESERDVVARALKQHSDTPLRVAGIDDPDERHRQVAALLNRVREKRGFTAGQAGLICITLGHAGIETAEEASETREWAIRDRFREAAGW